MGSYLETSSSSYPILRINRTLVFSIILANFSISLISLGLFTTSGYEPYLYSPLNGISAIPIIFSILLTQANTSLVLFEKISVQMVPLSLLCLSSFLELIIGGDSNYSSGDTKLGFFAGCFAWLYLRYYIYNVSVPLPCLSLMDTVGDSREEMEFLNFLPEPLRIACRPLEKLGSAIFLPIIKSIAKSVNGSSGTNSILPTTSSSSSGTFTTSTTVGNTSSSSINNNPSLSSTIFGAAAAISRNQENSTGSGNRMDINLSLLTNNGSNSSNKLLMSTTGSSGPSIDPIAERRREKALKALDKKLAEMKQKKVEINTLNNSSVGSTNASGTGQ